MAEDIGIGYVVMGAVLSGTKFNTKFAEKTRTVAKKPYHGSLKTSTIFFTSNVQIVSYPRLFASV